MKLSRAQMKRFKSVEKRLEQRGEGLLGDIASLALKAAKSIVRGGVELVKFTLKGARAISGLLEEAGIPPSDQVAFLAWMATSGKYAAAAKALSAASVAIKQAGRGDGESKAKDVTVDLSKGAVVPAVDTSQRARSSGSTPARPVDLSADNVIQLAQPNADQPYDTNKELPQLAEPNASLGSTPLFAGMDMAGGGRVLTVKGVPRAWGNSTQGNVIAATADASPEF